MALLIDMEDRSGVSVLRLKGDLTGTDDGALVGTVKRLLETQGARVVLDMGQVSFMSSAGLGDLVRITAQANTQGSRVLLANLAPFVRNVLSATRLEDFFEVRDDVDTALEGLK